ncbi:MAG TPA: hypothetical protein VIU16_01830, partial [Gaiellaceae bacterium]
LSLTEPATRDALVRRAARGTAAAARPLLPLLRRELRPARRSSEPLTDDRAPVEWLTDRMILGQIERGGGLDERPLPTAP